MIAYGVGLAASFFILALFGVIDATQAPREIVGKVAIQSVPASFGAVLANSQLAGDAGPDDGQKRRKEQAGYSGQLLFMVAGAVFMAFNVAPTEEMILISYVMTRWHGLLLLAASLLVMHGFVYGAGFRGTPTAPEGTPQLSLFLRYTVVGYAVALLVSAYVLWTFGRFDSTPFMACLKTTLVLAFPASLGAAAARLIL
jgi:putative integral membrane protein (TIGR02587 family)